MAPRDPLAPHQQAPTSASPPLRVSTQVLYAMGAAASATKQSAIAGFLLIFYNQVVGLSPATVSAVITISLICDALFDPLVGQSSDNFRHRWGRRHPFMYLAAIPVPIAFFLLWNPPIGWSEGAMFIYLLCVLLTIRLFDTFFELPSAALLPELTEDYHQRTVLFTYRSLFSAAATVLLNVAAYQWFLRERADGSGGVLARDGYFAFSVTFAIVICLIIVVSALGTHSRIPYLRKLKAAPFSLVAMAREMFATLSNRAFLIIVSAGMLRAIAHGVFEGLGVYFWLFFWELTQGQIALVVVASTAGIFTGAPFAPLLVRKFGKKTVWLAGQGLAVIGVVVPVTLRLFELMPPNGTILLVSILLGARYLQMIAVSVGSVSVSSMIADVVEDVEVKTGRRSEGLLLAADNFFTKLVSSSGILVAGIILTLLNFPRNAERGEVDPTILFNMGLIWIPTYLVLVGGAIALMTRFPITEARHNANLARLREARPAE